jgi:hypothetical protein
VRDVMVVDVKNPNGTHWRLRLNLVRNFLAGRMPYRKNFADRRGRKALLAPPDKSFCRQDVIHKTFGLEFPLCKFIRPAQNRSGWTREPALHRGWNRQ